MVVDVVEGGDLSNAHSRGAIENPVYRTGKLSGCCCVCFLDKSKWGDEQACAEAIRRNQAWQHTCNHVDWRRFVPGGERLEPFRCPFCLVLVDKELEEKEVVRSEWLVGDLGSRVAYQLDFILRSA